MSLRVSICKSKEYINESYSPSVYYTGLLTYKNLSMFVGYFSVHYPGFLVFHISYLDTPPILITKITITHRIQWCCMSYCVSLFYWNEWTQSNISHHTISSFNSPIKHFAVSALRNNRIFKQLQRLLNYPFIKPNVWSII